MKIRKVEEKPMVLHTRKKPTLHIQKKKKLTGNDKPKSYIQVRGKGRADKKEKPDSSVKVRNRKLYTMASVSVKKASEQMDGGEEIRDSVEMIQTAVYPVQSAAEKGKQLYRRKKHRDRSSQKKRNSRVHSDTEHAQVSNKMRRKAAGKKETGRKGQNKSRQGGSGVHSFVKSQMLNSFLDKFSTEKEFSQDGLIEGTTKTAKAAVMMAVQDRKSVV